LADDEKIIGTEDQAAKTENEFGKADDISTETEDITPKAEDEVLKPEGEGAKAQNLPAKTEGKAAAAEDKKEKRGKFVKKLKLILILIVVWLAIAGIMRLAIYLSSVSRTHLSDEGLTHAIRFQNSVVVHGIDVSEHQDDINWRKVKSSEADFVFVRAGYRSSETGELKTDEDFEENMKKANRAGLMTGAYFFSQALNEEEAIEEADYLIDLVKSYDIDMPLVIDFELIAGGRLQKAVEAGDLPVASLYHDIVLAFCRRVEEAGYESAVYANYDMLTNYMDSSILDDEAVIWAAQYDSACYVKGNYLFWQCAEDASIGGINGPVDHDLWYIEPGRVYATKAAGKKNQVSIGECEITFDAESYTLRNNRAKPKVTVTYGDKKLRKGKDYELSFVRNTTTGTGYAIVRGIGKYKDWTSAPFIIVGKGSK